MSDKVREALQAIIDSRDMLSDHYREYDRAARMAREALTQPEARDVTLSLLQRAAVHWCIDNLGTFSSIEADRLRTAMAIATFDTPNKPEARP